MNGFCRSAQVKDIGHRTRRIGKGYSTPQCPFLWIYLDLVADIAFEFFTSSLFISKSFYGVTCDIIWSFLWNFNSLHLENKTAYCLLYFEVKRKNWNKMPYAEDKEELVSSEVVNYHCHRLPSSIACQWIGNCKHFYPLNKTIHEGCEHVCHILWSQYLLEKIFHLFARYIEKHVFCLI